MIRFLTSVTLLLVFLALAVWLSSASTEMTGSWTIDRTSTVAVIQRTTSRNANNFRNNDPLAAMLYQSTFGAAIDQTAFDAVSNWTLLLTIRDDGTFTLRESTILFDYVELNGVWEYRDEDRNTVVLSIDGQHVLAIRRGHRDSRLHTIIRNQLDEDGALAVLRKPRRIEIPFLAAKLWWNSR